MRAGVIREGEATATSTVRYPNVSRLTFRLGVVRNGFS